MDVPLSGILGIGCCLVFSAFFSGSETALTTLGRAKTQRLLHDGGKAARSLELWAESPGAVLTTILIYNNLVNITASALATEVANRMLTDVDAAGISPVAVAVGVMTLLLLTFGEIIPKSLARTHAARISAPIMRIIKPLHIIVSPLTAAFVALARALGASDSKEPIVNEEDLGWLIDLGEAEGSISDEQAKLLQSVFELDDRTASEVMVPLDSVVSVPVDIQLPQLLRVLVAAGHSRVPVHAGEATNVVGICYAKDVLRHIAELGTDGEFHVRQLARPAEHVAQDKRIDVLLREMQERRVHLAMVVDGTPQIIGVITLEDIIEELIGEVYDEHDRAGMSRTRLRDLLAHSQTGPTNKPTQLARPRRVE
ncbi:MAG: CBS domain containing-hemolysin-like protein [Bradymonadia bacterium]|jgi:CBS domain containing-hemolysin-like protein